MEELWEIKYALSCLLQNYLRGKEILFEIENLNLQTHFKTNHTVDSDI